MRELEGRGIKDPEKLKYQQQRKQELERRQEETEKQNIGGGGLKVGCTNMYSHSYNFIYNFLTRLGYIVISILVNMTALI
jgi:hypothetical protein